MGGRCSGGERVDGIRLADIDDDADLQTVSTDETVGTGSHGIVVVDHKSPWSAS